MQHNSVTQGCELREPGLRGPEENEAGPRGGPLALEASVPGRTVRELCRSRDAGQSPWHDSELSRKFRTRNSESRLQPASFKAYCGRRCAGLGHGRADPRRGPAAGLTRSTWQPTL
eukprot:746643-Hanusia_phi.AAC.1